MPRWTAAALALLTTLALAIATGTQIARAGADACTPRCVILIEVDGLEPKDVTPQTTPFLWALGHSTATTTPSTGDPTGTLPNPAVSTPGISGRSGFTWQAGRSAMTAGTAPNTAALLTGGYSAQSNIPSDDYLANGKLGSERWLTSPLQDNMINADSGNELLGSTLLQQVQDAGHSAAGFMGDPGLFNLVTTGFTNGTALLDPTSNALQGADNGVFWSPGTQGDPAYCTPPHDVNPDPSAPSAPPPPVCDAPDAQTLEQALTGLTTDPHAGKVQFAFIELAEIGAIKRLYGDTDGLAVDASGAPIPPTAVADALHTTDEAIGEFVNRYNQDTTNGSVKWPKTTFVVVGSHGYESTPIVQRVPDPTQTDSGNAGSGAARDLTDYVAGMGATLIPQGTIGTIYYSGDDKSSKLAAIRDKLLDPTSGPNGTAACQNTGGCIQDVLYVHDDPLAGSNTLAAKYPGWHLEVPGKSTAGDLVVIIDPGWALGREAPFPTTDSADGSVIAASDVVNPFNASDGGPRDRAIFTLVNGPDAQTVVPWPTSGPGGGRYPVTVSGESADNCPAAPQDAVSADVNAVNSDPGNDADAIGHECQPETVDFAPTMAALMSVSLPDTQLAGRFLQEAFKVPLAFPKDEVLPPPDPQPEPAAPAVEIYIPPPPPPPPPPKGFDFTGLVRYLHAQVVDANGCGWTQAKSGSKLDYLKIEGDFGKQLAAVTLTFYRRAPAAKSASAASARGFAFASVSKCKGAPSAARAAAVAPRVRLKAIAKFKAFTVQRGHVVLKLKVPDQFKPSYVGITVQEATKVARAQTANTQQPNFAGIGPKGGGIYTITDAPRLHTRKTRKRG